tara:strand:+ start:5804 stop:6196 length:393 start_codon:yes stop_codon:yes gene_type:complete
MTAFEAAGLYVGLFLILFFVLKANVGRVRISQRIDLGDGENDMMVRAIRAQGNAVEDVPILLVGLLAIAAMGGSVWLIHGLGVALLLARLLHFAGITQMTGLAKGRLFGTLLTVLVKLVTAIACIWLAVS